jgi:general secretion pathway protein K
MRPRARAERGAALLVTIVSIAVLTALAVDLAYESRVSLQIAANARDELRASYLARSGVALSRLVLSFQQRVDALTAATAPATPTAGPLGGVSIPRVNLWRLVPVGSELVGGLFPDSPPLAAAAPAGGGTTPSMGFDAVIDDEGRKVNAQLEGWEQAGSGMAPRVQSIYQLICDPRWDPLFEREDARGVRTTREDLLVRLHDWVDGGEQSSTLAASFGAGSCAMVAAPKPFEDAFGDENQPYDRGDDRYRVKNARMDSLDELYLIAGVGDAFMAAFGDALTVYLPRDGEGAKRNPNTLDPKQLVANATLIAEPQQEAVLNDPAFEKLLLDAVLARTSLGIVSLASREFAELVVLAGVRVNMNKVKDQFTDRSTTFQIRSTGRTGDVTTTIRAVVQLETAQQAGAVAAPGQLVHWREE